ncbi:MAG: hypothetical protein AABX70_06515 [Nanoarchaeota archaeon]
MRTNPKTLLGLLFAVQTMTGCKPESPPILPAARAYTQCLIEKGEATELTTGTGAEEKMIGKCYQVDLRPDPDTQLTASYTDYSPSGIGPEDTLEIVKTRFNTGCGTVGNDIFRDPGLNGYPVYSTTVKTDEGRPEDAESYETYHLADIGDAFLVSPSNSIVNPCGEYSLGHDNDLNPDAAVRATRTLEEQMGYVCAALKKE